jgi:hypothetical protein
MLVNGKQVQRISARQLSRHEIAEFRKRYILTEKGYLQKDARTFRKQESDEHIREVKLGEMNDEVSDINKDPSGKWIKESTKDRDYTDSEDPDALEKHV